MTHRQLRFAPIVLIVLLLPPVLRAEERKWFGKLRFSVALPDSRWHADMIITDSIPDDGMMIVDAHDTIGGGRFSIIVYNDPAERQDILAHRFIDTMKTMIGLKLTDSSDAVIGSKRTVRYLARRRAPDDSAITISMAIWAVSKNGFGYILIASKESMFPEMDDELMALARSFMFFGSPEELQADRDSRRRPALVVPGRSRLSEFVSSSWYDPVLHLARVWMIGLAVIIPLLIIVYRIRRRLNQEHERPESARE